MGLFNLITHVLTQSTLSSIGAYISGIATGQERSLVRSYTRVALDNNDHIVVVALRKPVSEARHVSVCSRVVAMSHMSGQRNKRSRHGSVVLNSSHATANKQKAHDATACCPDDQGRHR